MRSEGRGFSPAANSQQNVGALAPEAALLQGLKAPSTVLCVPAGLKPRPSRTLKWTVVLLRGGIE